MLPPFHLRTSARPKRVNKAFYSTFVTISVTILSIMVAFYGVTVVFLSQQAQQIRIELQASKTNITSSIRETNNAVSSFAYLIEPPINSSESWLISSEQEDNLFRIFSPYEKTNESFSTLCSSDVSSLLGNFSEASAQDEAVRDWLNSLNITRFKASYNLAEFSLHDIVDTVYTQFPAPPAYRDKTQTIVFLDSNSSSSKNFTNWFNSYSLFYNDVSAVHSKINESITGISQSYSDAAKLASEELNQLQKDNSVDTWTIESEGELITYDNAMSAYYPSVFSSLDSIYSSGINAETYINQYNLYVEQYNNIYSLLEVPFFYVAIGLMAFWGIILPMSLLSGSAELRLAGTKWITVLALASILGFAIGVAVGWYVLGTQIAGLIPPPPSSF
jgi:hypothetical protein